MRSSARLGPSILGYSISNSEWSQFGQLKWVIFELFLLASVLLSFVEDLRLPLGYGSAGCRVDSFTGRQIDSYSGLNSAGALDTDHVSRL